MLFYNQRQHRWFNYAEVLESIGLYGYEKFSYWRTCPLIALSLQIFPPYPQKIHPTNDNDLLDHPAYRTEMIQPHHEKSDGDPMCWQTFDVAKTFISSSDAHPLPTPGLLFITMSILRDDHWKASVREWLNGLGQLPTDDDRYLNVVDPNTSGPAQFPSVAPVMLTQAAVSPPSTTVLPCRGGVLPRNRHDLLFQSTCYADVPPASSSYTCEHRSPALALVPSPVHALVQNPVNQREQDLMKDKKGLRVKDIDIHLSRRPDFVSADDLDSALEKSDHADMDVERDDQVPELVSPPETVLDVEIADVDPFPDESDASNIYLDDGLPASFPWLDPDYIHSSPMPYDDSTLLDPDGDFERVLCDPD
ncbi:hypothetical protein B0H19DRAFT_1080815 [Mycena capillaripes]|nr:hypothetical protein B0H19DRAFT_1080815 [Mycena capillaripes]